MVGPVCRVDFDPPNKSDSQKYWPHQPNWTDHTNISAGFPKSKASFDCRLTAHQELAMKGNPQIIDALNRALTIELTAINQYFCQSKMCKNWGFLKLAAKHWEESIGEMKHADKIIERVLYLDGVPEIARYDVIRVGTNVKEQFENDLKLESGGVDAYNELVNLAIQLKDNGTHALALEILTESEEHVDWLETQLNLIQTVGLEQYLAQNLYEDEK
jgi:bacterioferritin